MPLSTSSSSHRLPKLNYVSTSSWVIGLLIASLLGLGAFNAVTDPYQFNRFAPALDIDRAETFRHQNTALWAGGEIGHVLRSSDANIDVVIVGDSRARSLTGSWGEGESRLVHLADGTVVLNAGFGGASLGETMEMARAVLNRIDPPDLVIIQTAIDDMMVPRTDRSIATALKFMREPWRYYFSARTGIRFVNDVRGSEVGGLRGPLSVIAQPTSLQGEFAPDESGALSDSYVIDSFDDLRPERRDEANFIARRMQRGLFQELINNTELIINPFIEEAADSGVDVLLFIPPMHPNIERQVMNDFGSYTRVLNSVLDPRAAVYDGLSFDGPSSLFTFSDSVHFRQGQILTYDMVDCARSGVSTRITDAGSAPCDGGAALATDGISPVVGDPPLGVTEVFDGATALPVCIDHAEGFVLSFSILSAAPSESAANSPTTPATPLRLGSFLIMQMPDQYTVRLGGSYLSFSADTTGPIRFDIVTIDGRTEVFADGLKVGEFETDWDRQVPAQFGRGYADRYWTGELSVHGLAPIELSEAGDMTVGEFGPALCPDPT